MFLKRVHARAIPDSRGEKTIEIQIGSIKDSAPQGKSTGKYETPPFHNSINWNIHFLNKAEFNLEINSFHDLKKIESFIKEKAKLKDAKNFGADALIALELVILRTLAKEQGKQLWQIINPNAKKMPVPVGNAIGGGLHSHNKDHPVFQEFLLIPKGKSFSENYQLMKSTHAKLKSLVRATKMNDEGAWETTLPEEQILEILSKFSSKINLGIDVASSSFFHNGEYQYKNKILDTSAQIAYMNLLIKKYGLLYLEDPLDELDFKNFAKIHHNKYHLVVGDDLTATHISRLRKAVKDKSINAMIIKPNQNGSLLEVAEIIRFCKEKNIKTILSHRSGETMDTALSDLAVGFQADFIKCGIATKWREAKLKRLIEIEHVFKIH